MCVQQILFVLINRKQTQCQCSPTSDLLHTYNSMEAEKKQK